MALVGYAYVCDTLKLSAPPPRTPARVRPVTRVERQSDHLAIPASVAPDSRDPLQHLLFALKHEGTHLGLLMEAMQHIAATDLQAELRRRPTGGYGRALAYLWEAAHGSKDTLDASAVAGQAHPLFDPDRYVTAKAQRNPRWRVDFNGIGTIRYCATVERTPALDALLARDVLAEARAYIQAMGADVRDRALAWAYLHETRDSFAIEKEAPTQDRAEAFVQLLRQAHEKRELSEDYLVELQQATITNPFEKAFAFRSDQNHLHNGQRGALGVSYVPPPPDVNAELMDELMALGNNLPAGVPPIVTAAIISFGFVFLHPFGDGNGRLSRFLFHHSLCRAGALPDGLILPVSVAMKKHEKDYLDALQSYSRHVRQRWSVGYIDDETFDFRYNGDAHFGLYRFWDATRCVEFMCTMAAAALEHELRDETEFLMRYDAIAKAVSARFDIRGSILSTLIIGALQEGRVSKRRRDQFGDRVPDDAFSAIEEALASTACVDAQPGGECHEPVRGNGLTSMPGAV